jgi:5'-3' exonuclease
MGVPGFFGWLLKQYGNNLILNSPKDKTNVLYIDANCLFHPECYKVQAFFKNETDIEKLEKNMMQRICNFIDYLVGHANPTDEVFIAVDGVAPLAKINQQRKRRFRAIDDNKIRIKIKKHHKKDVNDVWSNTVITPGTIFMENLHKTLIKHFQKKSSDNKGLKYTYSSYHTPGEGEHKILQDICSRKDTNCVNVIYGLDADLFFLAMASRRKNIYLLREASHFNNNKNKTEIIDPVTDVAEELKYVSIDDVKDKYNEQLGHLVEARIEINGNIAQTLLTEYCNDFIFICYLLGNDFLPHFPSINIKHDGLNIIIDSYIDVFLQLGESLIQIVDSKVKVNNNFLLMLLENLGEKETVYFSEILPKALNRWRYKKCFEADPYDRDLWYLENMQYRNKYVGNFSATDIFNLKKGLHSVDELNQYKFKYYEHYFNVSEHQQEHVDNMCKAYLEGLLWVGKYYFEKCPMWRWQYCYKHAPFISDLAKYMKINKVDINTILDNIVDEGPLHPYVQLASVLHPESHNLLPKSYQSIVLNVDSPVIDMFPVKTRLDMDIKEQFYTCIPELPDIDVNRMINACKNLKLTKEENIRNTLSNNFVYYKKN